MNRDELDSLLYMLENTRDDIRKYGNIKEKHLAITAIQPWVIDKVVTALYEYQEILDKACSKEPTP